MRLLSSVFALAALAAPLSAQTPLPIFDANHVVALAFRPGSTDELLVGALDDEYRLEVHLARLAGDGKALLLRTLPGFHVAPRWLDAGHVVSALDKTLSKWPVGGGAPVAIATLAEKVVGVGVAPKSRTLAVRTAGGPLRFFTPDGRPAGPAISPGPPAKSGDECADVITELSPAFSVDDRLIAFSSTCAELRVSAREGGRLVRPDVPRPYVKRHVFASDGRSLLVTYFGEPGGGGDVWPIFGGRLGNPLRLPGPIEHNDPADAAALPGGGFVVLSTHRLRFFAADTKLMRADIPIAGPRRVAVSDDGSRIAVAALEGLVLFDRAGERLAHRPFADMGAPAAVGSLPGGREFVTVSQEGIARVFDRDGRQSRAPTELWAHDTLGPEWYGDRVRLLIAPNGRHFAVFSPIGRFEVFDHNFARVGRPLHFPPNGPVKATALLDDRILRPLPQGAGFIVFGFDGRVIGRLDLSVPPRGEPQIAGSAAGTIATHSWDNKFRLWSAEGKLLAERLLTEHIGPLDRITMSADGRLVVLHAMDSYNGRMVTWRPQTNQIEGLEGAFVRLLPDGTLVRFAKGRLWIGEASVEIDADEIHAVTEDAGSALVGKNGVARLVAIRR